MPLRFADGYATAARVFSFDGLVDGQEHLAFGLGDRAAAVTSAGHAAGAAGAAAQRVPDRGRVRQPAVRLRAAAARSRRAHRRLRRLSCCICARRDGASACTPSSTPTRSRTRGWTPMRRTSRSGHREDERSYLVAAQMLQALGVSRVALLSNNPDKARQLRRFGVTVTARVPTGVHLSATNARYLATKAGRGAHTLDVPLSAG